MIEAVFPAVLSMLKADQEFLNLWAGVQKYLGESAPFLFPGQAPDEWPKPYVIYSLYDNEAAKFGPSQWPMKSFYLSFTAHDYSPNSARAYAMADRIGCVLTMENLRCDVNIATGVRLFENDGPVMVESDKKKDVAWQVTLPLKGYDVKAADTKLRKGLFYRGT